MVDKMNALEGIDGLSECIGRAIQEHLARSNINLAWPQIHGLSHPVLRVEAFIEDAGQAAVPATRTERVASVRGPVPMASRSIQFQSLYRSDSRARIAAQTYECPESDGNAVGDIQAPERESKRMEESADDFVANSRPDGNENASTVAKPNSYSPGH
jgi:hypothetical protein